LTEYITKGLRDHILRRKKEEEEDLLMGRAPDYTDYKVRCATLAAYEEILEKIADLETHDPED
jgi:hypothetical protein